MLEKDEEDKPFYITESQGYLETKGLTAESQAFLKDAGIGGTVSSSGIVINEKSALSATTVLSCVLAICEDIGKVRPFLYRVLDDGSRKILKTKDHPLVDVLCRPTGRISEGGWLTWPDFAGQLTANLMLKGNAYAIVVRNKRGAVKKLVPINAHQVKLEELYDGSLWWRFSAANYHEMNVFGGNTLFVPYENVLHLRNSLTDNGLLGLSRIHLAANAVGLGLAYEETANKWMGTGGRISGVLQTQEKLGKEVAKEIAQRWAEVYGGLRNTGKIAVLERGLEFHQVSMNAVDLDFIKGREFQITEISRIFRIPLYMLAVKGDGKMTAEQQAQDYVNYTLTTYTNIWAARLKFMFDLEDDEINVGWDFSTILQANDRVRYDTYRIGIMGSFLVPNEVRAKEGLPPVEGGDKLIMPSSTQPHGSDHSGTAPDGAGKPDGTPNSDQQQ